MYKELISNWLNPQTKQRVMDKSLDSRHIDDLLDERPNSPEDILSASFELYKELLSQYQIYSDEIMAMLVIGVKETPDLQAYSIEQLFRGGLELWPSPELYLVKREPNLEPYVVEEYKRPFNQTIIQPNQGLVYAYFRTMRNSTDDPYSPGFYFEHYPSGDAEHDWR